MTIEEKQIYNEVVITPEEFGERIEEIYNKQY